MSGILGVFGGDRQPVTEGLMRRLLDRMRSRGHDRAGIWAAGRGAIGVARNTWELTDGLSGDVLIVEDGDLVVAADASIYYRRELREKLAALEVRIGGTTSSHLILAAYRAWGEECTRHLEGDYAFILWDRKDAHLFSSRDFGGKRPLYYADLGDALVVASTMAAVLAHPDCPEDLNRVYLAETAAALWPSAHETAYRSISLLPAGWSLFRGRAGETRLTQHWHPPEIEPHPDVPFEDAALELRELVQRAVDERLDASGVTTVWLSGGWDSTAVFGAGQEVLRPRRTGQALCPVSISYPPGDPGREDELITAVAEHWAAPVHWLNIADIPLVEQPARRAALRDEPGAHAYENWNRALARGTRRVGAHVALDGNGGDQLFQMSPTFLGDLLLSGRWITFLREWRALGLRSFADFLGWVVKPSLSPAMLDVATMIRRGKRLHGTYERWMPPWTTPRLARTLAARQELHRPPREGRSRSDYETHVYLSSAFFPRIFGVVTGLALEEGVELRSPLFDGRVIEFAARRPWWERCSGGETKRLLRQAMSGLLPAHVLARRPFRTGTTSGYFTRETRKSYPAAFLAAGASWALGDLGIVDPARVAEACRQYLRYPDPDVGVALLSTLQVELWLRARHPLIDAPGEIHGGHDVVADHPMTVGASERSG